jgi:hypothetical protein
MFRKLRSGPRVALLLGVAALALAVPAFVIASHQFTDVPDSSPFHGDIGAIKDAGITAGKTCAPPGTPPTYCPAENVTREAMAAFLHRGFGRVALATFPTTDVPFAEGTSTWTISLTPGYSAAVAGASGFMKVDAKVDLILTDGTDCVCDFKAALFMPGYGYLHGSLGTATIYSTLDTATIALTGVAAVTGAGAKTVEVRVWRSFGFGPAGTANATGDATATYVPFGSAGGNGLGVAPMSSEEVHARVAREVAARKAQGRTQK